MSPWAKVTIVQSSLSRMIIGESNGILNGFEFPVNGMVNFFLKSDLLGF